MVLNWLPSQNNSKTLYIFRFNTGKSKVSDSWVAQGHTPDSLTVNLLLGEGQGALQLPGLKAVGVILHIMHDKWHNNHDTTFQQKKTKKPYFTPFDYHTKICTFSILKQY